MLISLDPTSSTPPSEQVMAQLVKAITTGALPTGYKLPSVRQLAGDLRCAPSTVAKVYKRLEELGYVATKGRNGTVVRAQPQNPVSDEVHAAALMLVRAAQRGNVDVEALLDVVRRTWASLPEARQR